MLSNATPQPKLPPRVLVIDDNRAIHDDFRKILGSGCAVDAEFDQLESLLLNETITQDERDPIELDSAYQGQEGHVMVQRAREEGRPYCLAFVDIRMPPGWDGIETVLKVWESDPEIQIVICSAYSDYSWEDMVRRLGHSDRFLVLKKPFDSIEVRQFVAALSHRWTESRTDVLTGLLNRRAFRDQSLRQTETSDRLSCVMLDLDYFKRINDRHGHQAGDTVLRRVAEALSEHSRQGDLVCRYGGEELCVLLRGADEAAATAWSERVRQAISQMPIEARGETVQVTGSFGVAERLDETTTIEVLLDRADQALQAAKRDGRNRVASYSGIDPLESSTPYKPNRFEGVTAADLMEPPHVVLASEEPLGVSIGKMLKHATEFAPVVDASGTLVGTLTHSRVLTVPIPSERLAAPTGASMRPDMIRYERTTPLGEVFDCLVRADAPRVVIHDQDRPCGVIDRTALVRWLFTTGYQLAHSDLQPEEPEATHGATLPLPLAASSVSDSHSEPTS